MKKILGLLSLISLCTCNLRCVESKEIKADETTQESEQMLSEKESKIDETSTQKLTDEELRNALNELMEQEDNTEKEE